MATAGPLDAQTVTAKVKTLINTQLKTILKREGLPVSGAKALMQGRIIGQISDYARTGNVEGFNRIRTLVNNPDASLSPSTTTSTTFIYTAPNHQTPNTMVHGSGRNPGGIPPNMAHTYGPARPNFKSSPFYTVIEPLTPVLECKAINQQNIVRESTRDHLEHKINLKADTVDSLLKDSTLKIMVYCASEPVTPFTTVDVAFPHQVEIRINQDEVKSNLLRGLKNKPGSTRPADVTNLLRKRAGYENTMTVTYALTIKKFYVVVNLVKQHPSEELVQKLKDGKHIVKEQVIREMVSKAQDTDIVATSSIMSLKCPLSTLRLDVPCRSTICTHNQCFDALSFLQLQEQAPTWTCPVCNKIVSFEALEVDDYVSDILKNTPRAVDQVTIEPNGKWLRLSQSDVPLQRNGAHSDSDDDDDLIEIQDMPRIAAVKNEAIPVSGSMTRTPPYSSREQSTGSATAPRSGTGKRPIGQVIDLTFSSDEDDQPPRAPAPKRQNTQTSLASLSSIQSNPGNDFGNPVQRSNGLSFGLPRPAPVRTPGSSEYLSRGYGSPS